MRRVMETFHGEAFNLMTYRCESCQMYEIIWNSRDGVTPFMVTCRKCKSMMQHEAWSVDVFAPWHTPKPGDLVFVDLTEERALKFADKFIKIPEVIAYSSEHGPSLEEVHQGKIEELLREIRVNRGPDLRVVKSVERLPYATSGIGYAGLRGLNIEFENEFEGEEGTDA